MFELELVFLFKQLFPNGGGISKILNGVLILALEEFHIAFKIIMLNHMIITKLDALSNII